jgi:hypothetical protein
MKPGNSIERTLRLDEMAVAVRENLYRTYGDRWLFKLLMDYTGAIDTRRTSRVITLEIKDKATGDKRLSENVAVRAFITLWKEDQCHEAR